MIANLHPGGVALLENTRFIAGEQQNDPEMAAVMANFSDFWVNDAFSAAHRAHASTVGVAHLLPSYGARALQAELEALEAVLGRWQEPSIAMIRGAKISTKLDIPGRLVGKVDSLVIGGAMANTLLAAKGETIGKSAFEPELIYPALRIMDKVRDEGCRISLPSDVVVACELTANPSSLRTKSVQCVRPDEMILDFGPRSVSAIAELLCASPFPV